MDLKTMLIIAGLVALLLLSNANAGATTAMQSGNCLQSIQAQYTAQWAEMNSVQRAVVGLRAAGCEGGQR